MSIKVFDFFSGCGGTSLGFNNAGLEVVFALDNDLTALESFNRNMPDAYTMNSDIKQVSPVSLETYVGIRDKPILFCGCAPCQPFSRQNNHKSNKDPRLNLLSEFFRFVKYWIPEYVVVENVPGMQCIKGYSPFNNFVSQLKCIGYNVSYKVVSAGDYGVPQKRERLILIATTISEIEFPKCTHGNDAKKEHSTVRDWIDGLPTIEAGETDDLDQDHRAAKLSEMNLKRIRATPEGRGRNSWPKELWLNCHKNHSGHTDVYGRLHWDKRSSGLTTKCISYSNGRFGHPLQDRALSIREAACLQTFPRTYRFSGTLQSKARQIGNAVPPLLAQRIGDAILKHYIDNKEKLNSTSTS